MQDVETFLVGIPESRRLSQEATRAGFVTPPALAGCGANSHFPKDGIGRGKGEGLPFPVFGWVRPQNELGSHKNILPTTTPSRKTVTLQYT